MLIRLKSGVDSMCCAIVTIVIHVIAGSSQEVPFPRSGCDKVPGHAGSQARWVKGLGGERKVTVLFGTYMPRPWSFAAVYRSHSRVLRVPSFNGKLMLQPLVEIWLYTMRARVLLVSPEVPKAPRGLDQFF